MTGIQDINAPMINPSRLVGASFIGPFSRVRISDSGAEVIERQGEFDR
jgi:hypothetical protein